jgi:GH43 family beta-xylosidase
VDYGSFAVSDGAVSGSKDGKFYFTYSTQDTDYNYNN